MAEAIRRISLASLLAVCLALCLATSPCVADSLRCASELFIRNAAHPARFTSIDTDPKVTAPMLLDVRDVVSPALALRLNADMLRAFGSTSDDPVHKVRLNLVYRGRWQSIPESEPHRVAIREAAGFVGAYLDWFFPRLNETRWLGRSDWSIANLLTANLRACDARCPRSETPNWHRDDSVSAVTVPFIGGGTWYEWLTRRRAPSGHALVLPDILHAPPIEMEDRLVLVLFLEPNIEIAAGYTNPAHEPLVLLF